MKKTILALIVVAIMLAACTSHVTIKSTHCKGDPKTLTDCTTSEFDVVSKGSVF